MTLIDQIPKMDVQSDNLIVSQNDYDKFISEYKKYKEISLKIIEKKDKEIAEYKKALKNINNENEKLKIIVNERNEQLEELDEHLERHHEELETLHINNSIMEKKYNKLNNKIDKLEIENNNLIKKVNEKNKQVELCKGENNKKLKKIENSLKAKNAIINVLEKKIENLNNKIYYNKFIIAFQDLNNFLNLNYTIDPDYIHVIDKLRKERNNDFHYLDFENLSEFAIRRYLLLEKINNMPESLKQIFDNKHKGLIETIKPFIYPYEETPINNKNIDYWNL